jgi:hypothetical protein
MLDLTATARADIGAILIASIPRSHKTRRRTLASAFTNGTRKSAAG